MTPINAICTRNPHGPQANTRPLPSQLQPEPTFSATPFVLPRSRSASLTQMHKAPSPVC